MTLRKSAGGKNHAPTGISMDMPEAIVEHTKTGTVLTRFYAHDRDGDALSFKLLDNAGGRFKLVGDNLVVANGAKLDAKSYMIGMQVSDGRGGTMKGAFEIDVQDFATFHKYDHGPFGLALAGSEKPVAEHAGDGTAVGSFFAFDNDGGPLTYTLLGDAGGRFKMDGDNLVIADGSKLEGGEYTVNVKVTDKNGLMTSGDFTIDVGRELSGNKGADALLGSRGRDKLNGGLGRDVLTGDAGKDTFVFNTKLGKGNVDKIVDFIVKDDTIAIAKSIFAKAGSKGALSKAAFWMGDKAHDANDRIIYNAKKGALYYDADGTGSHEAVKIAGIARDLTTLSHKDFLII
jgi:Ca2+-binding RTX toxin-like protein